MAKRDEIEVQAIEIPAWAMRLIYRLGMLRKGEAYALTIILSGDEPSWTVQPLGKLENER